MAEVIIDSQSLCNIKGMVNGSASTCSYCSYHMHIVSEKYSSKSSYGGASGVKTCAKKNKRNALTHASICFILH